MSIDLRRAGGAGRRTATALAVIVASYAIVLIVVPAVRPPFLRDRVLTVPVAVFAHLGAGALALLLGPFQFNAALRERRLGLHRWLGRSYLVAVAAGGVSGLALARISQGGVVAHAGFACLAVLWLLTAAMAYRSIRAGRPSAHRRWMIRNYAFTFAAVTLRLYLPLGLALGARFDLAYPAIAWLCWVPNALAAECLLALETKGAMLRGPR